MTITPPRTAVRRLALARLISVTGGAAAYAALMFTVYERTRSPAWLSASLILTFGVGGIVSPFAGALGDRFDRRRLMVASDLCGAACFAVMALVDSPGSLLAVAFVAAVVETPFWTASGAAVPNLVAKEDLGWANGLIAVGGNAGIMIGPAVGGVLVAAIGPSWVFALNAVSFVVSAALAFAVHGSFSGDRSDAHEHRGLRAGFVFLARERVLRAIVLAWVAITAGAGMAMVADVPLTELFGTGSVGYGLMIGCWGAGSVVGSLGGRFVDERNELRVLVAGPVLIAVATGAIAVSPWFGPILGLILLSGVGDAMMGVAEAGIQQRRTPDAVRSRVMAAAEAVVTVSIGLSFAAGGLALRLVGPQGVYAIAGVTAGIAALVLVPVARSARVVVVERVMTPRTIRTTEPIAR